MHANGLQELINCRDTVTLGFMGLWYAGMKMNPLDATPNHAVTITAISNGIRAVGGILPLVSND